MARTETFDSLAMWLREVEQFSLAGGKEVVKLLVGNKIDQNKAVSSDAAKEWATSRGMMFMEASAKTEEGISQIFTEVVRKVMIYLSVESIIFILSIICTLYILLLPIRYLTTPPF